VGYVVFRYDFYDLSPIARDIVLQEANDAMFVLDSESRLVDHNTAAREIVPDLAEESTGSPLSDLHVELARVADELQEGNQRELRLSFDGVSRHFSAQASNITVNSESIGTVLFLRDITERQRREQQLERQNDRLDQFASMVSHDLRNPLNVAQLRTELVTEEYDDNNAQMAQEALDRMETMIDEMLHLARAGQDIETTEQCRLMEPVQRAWASVPTADSTLETHVNGTTVVADPSRLSQVFENLFRNALEHNEKPPAVRVGTLTSGDGFYIEDDGDGIPEDERNDIFDHGYTTTEGGSGLGLAIVSDVVEAHGWSITATESEDGGARFEIRTD
jgi:PAS domain S-box-containing protein